MTRKKTSASPKPGKMTGQMRVTPVASPKESFTEVIELIQQARQHAYQTVNTTLIERTVLARPKVSPPVTLLHPAAESLFKDTYLLDFLDLPDGHTEADLQQALIANLKRFLLELGRDFSFVGEQYLLQVGRKDSHLDLLFYHRELQCLVAFELKIDEFRPAYIGQLEFYLEALDRDVRKSHERPSIGVLLCATKDNEVVEYALSRTLSPALIAEYQTCLPDKRLLQKKLHEFYAMAQSPEKGIGKKPVKKNPTNPTEKHRAKKS